MTRKILILLITLLLLSCTNKDVVYEPTTRTDPYKIYDEAYNAFEKGDYFYAEKKFSEAELNFDIIEYASKSAIMASYCLYGISFYDEAIDSINNFLKKYPADKNTIYAHYLIALIYFEQIADEKKDVEPILKAKEKIDFFLITYPNSDYALDLKFKKDLIINQIAAKELYVAKYYASIQKWIPAINRLKIIVKDYDQTIFIEEALHRLVEVYYKVGLVSEANAAASILGYNYNSGEWYKQSYKVLNKKYNIEKKIKKKKNMRHIERTIKKIMK